MTKKLNVEAITNELHGASLFFNPPKLEGQPVVQDISLTPPPVREEKPPIVQSREQVNTRTAEHANARTPEHMNTRTGEQTNRRTPERVIARQSYNVYEDQHEALKRLEAQSTLSGGKPLHISEMVRQALDAYLAKKQDAGMNTRTGERPNE